MSRLGTFGLSSLVLAFLVASVKADQPDDAADPDAQVKAESFRPIEVANPSESQERAKIMKALEEPTEFEFNEIPLKDVVAYLKDRHHIEIQLATKVLEEASIGTETPVTRNLQSVSLRSALRLMLGAMDLTYVVKDEVLLITTIEAANADKAVMIYPVSDLIAADPTCNGGAALIEIIKASIAPKTWRESGSDNILPFALGEALVIRQTPAVHEEVELLLTGLRRAREVALRHRGNKAVANK